MESASGHFKTLNRDIIVNIMSRLNGCTLTATASTCTDLRDATKDEIIWKKLCHETWPPTSMKQLPFRGGFKSLHTHAFPLILYNEAATQFPKQSTTLDTSSSARDLTSLIDIYFKGRCIISKTMEGITEGTENDHFD
ncbi:hypothetical protein BUALT_Bualt10G0001600 [Buddleja alternifolia]|uniref:F-box domain-containing protein n=1 Tax=Buddleja alternifolia TaxID=168488 RepID=A0AAV6WVW4_9LAMI|nr:hypothetical protein BUALT_Bualt10G0001600 [Buddleja alternifolia]